MQEIVDSSDAIVQKMNQSMNITSTFSSYLTFLIVEFSDDSLQFLVS